MKNKAKVAIVIPAYNEEQTIGDVLGDIENSSKTINDLSIVVVVVNDGSTDHTSLKVKKYKQVILINHILNSGAGAATRTGINFAKSLDVDYVVTMDADGQHHYNDVLKIINYAIKNKLDFVIGSRLINSKGMPWYKIIGNKGLSLITFLLFGVFVTDSQSGLKVLSKKCVETISFHSNTFAFCSEMIWQAHKSKLLISEVPIQAIYTEYSKSKGQSNWGAIHIVGQLIKRRFMEFIDG